LRGDTLLLFFFEESQSTSFNFVVDRSFKDQLRMGLLYFLVKIKSVDLVGFILVVDLDRDAV